VATSPVDICNLALAAIGTRSKIADLAEGSTEADACATQYDASLEAVLQSAHWNFARKQIALTLLKDATADPPDDVPQPWMYEYAYPSDCVQGRYIMPDMQTQPATVPGAASAPLWVGPQVKFLVSSDVDSRGNPNKVILCNQASAILVYTSRIKNVALFDGQFVLALANYLGARICMQLTGDKQKMEMAFNLADRITRNAQASNGNEGLTIIDNTPDWVRARGYLSDWAYPAGAVFWQAPQSLTMIS
jgi:hypothetical protein